MEGINYYNNLLQELKNFNITPIVTIYHWELPQSLQELGGFTNAEFVNWFKDYSSVLFQWFGDYVKFWITFNEPWQICERGYGSADLAPALNASGVANYICGHHLLKAHAEVYHMYTTDYKDHYGKLGISADSKWFQPLKDTSSDDLEASETAMQYYVRNS